MARGGPFSVSDYAGVPVHLCPGHSYRGQHCAENHSEPFCFGLFVAGGGVHFVRRWDKCLADIASPSVGTGFQSGKFHRKVHQQRV